MLYSKPDCRVRVLCNDKLQDLRNLEKYIPVKLINAPLMYKSINFLCNYRGSELNIVAKCFVIM